ncbi:hypothetical protein BDB01DRAFT_834513 [Pilobolus umbonatus]|nr:hypothetical protein BDB01DRAFT_834513 [Pilobolus umbonatus]
MYLMSIKNVSCILVLASINISSMEESIGENIYVYLFITSNRADLPQMNNKKLLSQLPLLFVPSATSLWGSVNQAESPKNNTLNASLLLLDCDEVTDLLICSCQDKVQITQLAAHVKIRSRLHSCINRVVHTRLTCFTNGNTLIICTHRQLANQSLFSRASHVRATPRLYC